MLLDGAPRSTLPLPSTTHPLCCTFRFQKERALETGALLKELAVTQVTAYSIDTGLDQSTTMYD